MKPRWIRLTVLGVNLIALVGNLGAIGLSLRAGDRNLGSSAWSILCATFGVAILTMGHDYIDSLRARLAEQQRDAKSRADLHEEMVRKFKLATEFQIPVPDDDGDGPLSH